MEIHEYPHIKLIDIHIVVSAFGYRDGFVIRIWDQHFRKIQVLTQQSNLTLVLMDHTLRPPLNS